MEEKRYAIIVSLGCRLNIADSALITGRLEKAGFTVIEDGEKFEPSLVVVNSCSVTAEAARKSRQIARQYRRRYPCARIIATGCSAEVDRETWLSDSLADAVLTNPEKRRIEEFCADIMPEDSGCELSIKESPEVFFEKADGRFPFRSRAFLKIQEGCNNFCTYCIVPYTRGPERSRDFDEVIADCRHSIEAGFPELVLTGVNTAAYCDKGRDLGVLVSEICALPGDFRVRLSSTEPHPSNRRFLEVLRDNPKVCRFLHLSLQHGADSVLARMNRKYTSAEFADFVHAAREMIPGISIGTDVIVGFPGETDEEFEISREFIEKMAFANTHLFSYSPRLGTPAATFPNQVYGDVVKNRYAQLRKVADRSRREFIRGQIGKSVPVIFEETAHDGCAVGWSDHYIHIRRPADTVKMHCITRVTVEESDLVFGESVLL